MTTTTHLTQDDLHQIELDKEREENKKQIQNLLTPTAKCTDGEQRML